MVRLPTAMPSANAAKPPIPPPTAVERFPFAVTPGAFPLLRVVVGAEDGFVALTGAPVLTGAFVATVGDSVAIVGDFVGTVGAEVGEEVTSSILNVNIVSASDAASLDTPII